MAIEMAPLFVALCISNQSWVAELKAPREAFTPPSLHVSFCRSQIALHRLDKDHHESERNQIACIHVLDEKNSGVGPTQGLAHTAAVGQCVRNFCDEMKSNSETFTESELDRLRALLYNSGKTESEIESTIKRLVAMPTPKRQDCLENSSQGYKASALAWDFCATSPYRCGQLEER